MSHEEMRVNDFLPLGFFRMTMEFANCPLQATGWHVSQRWNPGALLLWRPSLARVIGTIQRPTEFLEE
jgi:hypothetical protein